MNVAGDECGDERIEESVRRNFNETHRTILERLLADVPVQRRARNRMTT